MDTLLEGINAKLENYLPPVNIISSEIPNED
jgi:hypothetical protein